jgi:DNA-3-methyladenine glycosylase I
MTSKKCRCSWVSKDPVYIDYHDNEWGIPIYSSHKLFKQLMLEGQQAGLSWLTILKRRDSYNASYADFNPEEIVQFDSKKINQLLTNPGVVRHRQKIEAIINNARCYLAMQGEGLNFSDWMWAFVDGEPIHNLWPNQAAVPTQTPRSQAMSKQLKAQGFQFVGPTICYAFMQAVGMVNDHTLDCDWSNKQKHQTKTCPC